MFDLDCSDRLLKLGPRILLNLDNPAGALVVPRGEGVGGDFVEGVGKSLWVRGV